MKRRILIALFSVGTVGGFTLGTIQAVHAHREHRAYFEQHVARVCVEAAKAAETPATTAPSP